MGSGFIEKHKKKSLLAALLFFFTGRAKYLAVLLLVAAVSMPFVVSRETLNKFLGMPSVALALRAMGLGGFLSSSGRESSSEFVKAAMDKAAEGSARNSYWNRLMGAVNTALPCESGCGDVSSLAMVKGGGDLYGSEAGKAGKRRPGPGEVTGVVSAGEKARGEGADVVDLEGVLGGGAGGGLYGGGAGGPGGAGGGLYGGGAGGPDGAGGSGLYGSVMGRNLGGRFSGGASNSDGSYANGNFISGSGSSNGGAGPYVNRSLISRPGGSGIGDRKAGIYAAVVKQLGGKIPVPARPRNISGKMTGRASGFSWRNVGFRSEAFIANTQIGTRMPLSQLAETLAVGDAALQFGDSANASKAAYAGAAYDGNNINLGVMRTDALLTGLPKDGFIIPDIPVIPEIPQIPVIPEIPDMKIVDECVEATKKEGVTVSSLGGQITALQRGMGSPPRCYNPSGVSSWNNKLRRLEQLCMESNASAKVLSEKCKTPYKPRTCAQDSLMVKKCANRLPSCCGKCYGCKAYRAFLIALAIAIIIAIGIIMGPVMAVIAALALIALYIILSGSGAGGGSGGSQYEAVDVSGVTSNQLDGTPKAKPPATPPTQTPTSADYREGPSTGGTIGED